MGAMALHGYSSMELKSRSFTSKEPHVAREPQVENPCLRRSFRLVHKSSAKIRTLRFLSPVYRNILQSTGNKQVHTEKTMTCLSWKLDHLI
jgi:hypothetical protein